MSLVYTAFSATAVNSSILCNFTSASEFNLILNKFSHIEIYLIKENELKLIHDIPIYGRVAIIQAFKPKSESETDLLLVTTQKCCFCVLKYSKNKVISTKANGDLRNIFGKNNDFGQMGGIDPSCSAFCLHFLQGIIKVVPIVNQSHKDMQFKTPFNARIPELNVIAMAFLHDLNRPLVGILWQDMDKKRRFKTYEINFSDEQLVESSCFLNECDSTATILQAVPKPLGGVLIIGERLALYKSFQGQNAIAMELPGLRFKCISLIDKKGERWLLGEESGRLFLMTLILDSKNRNCVISIGFEMLGIITIPSCLTYIDKGIVFIGSISGDCQLIQLLSGRNEEGSFVEVIENFQSLAPIHDFCTVDIDGIGQDQIIACCGSSKEGSLKILRSGISFSSKATLDISELNVKRLWSLKLNQQNSLLMISSPLSTKSLLFDGKEAEEIPFLVDSGETLYSTNIGNDIILHVSQFHIRLLIYFGSQFVIKREWKASDRILHATGFANAVAVSLAKENRIFIFDCSSEFGIVEKNTTSFQEQVSAISISATIFIASFWNSNEIHIYNANCERKLLSVPILISDSLCRNIFTMPLTTEIDDLNYVNVFLGFGNGKIQLVNLQQSPSKDCSLTLMENKIVNVGVTPIEFRHHPFQESSVIVCCDKPLMITCTFPTNIEYHRINKRNIIFFAPVHNSDFCNNCWISDDKCISLSSIEDQKLSTTSIPLRLNPRRLAFDFQSESIAVLTVSLEEDSSVIKIFDSYTLQETSSIALEQFEIGQSLECIVLDNCSFYVVGSSFRSDEEDEPSRGKIKLFRIVGNKKIEFAFEFDVPGCVYSIAQFTSSMFAATYRDSVAVFTLSQKDSNSSHVLSQVCFRKGYIVALQVKCRGKFLIVGDLLRSVNILTFNSERGILEEKARDLNMNTVLALDFLSDECFIGADDYCNIFQLTSPLIEANEIEKRKLLPSGCYHLGDMINTFKCRNHEPSYPALKKYHHPPKTESTFNSFQDGLWFCTVSGSIGVVIPLSPTQFGILYKVQAFLNELITATGNLSHANFRSFLNERRSSPCENFLDGNLLELFHSLESTIQKKIIGSLQETSLTESEIRNLLDDIKRIV